MALKKLVNPSAFGAGADLWIIPDPNSSPWSRKIDWYLNLQILRAQNHQTTELPSKIQEILIENEIQWVSPRAPENCALLVNGRDHLPTRSVLCIYGELKPKEWIQKGVEIWEKLNQPTVRAFLPESFDDALIDKFWPKNHRAGISYVLAQSPLEE